ncbi:unnamed protein product [Linum trigynum]|uniref:Uncharacterized protein n=1 Tax=Linum trigynum TaxID=586398 RepID=A0AAV2CXY3_9ROSI
MGMVSTMVAYTSKYIVFRRVYQKLDAFYFKSYQVMEHISVVAYKLQLSETTHICRPSMCLYFIDIEALLPQISRIVPRSIKMADWSLSQWRFYRPYAFRREAS